MNPIKTDASALTFTDGTQQLGTKAGVDGHVLTWDTGTSTWRAEAAAAAGIGGSTGGVDDALLRANGTGGATVQSSTATLSDAGLLTVGELSLTTDLAVTHGGTGAGTAAGARDNIVWSGAGAIDPASPYTVVAGVDTITLGSSKTVAPRALANYADGQMIRIVNSSASSITVTITPADGTIDGGASVALTVAAKGIVGCVRLSASTWGSVQPGTALGVVRLRGYIDGGTAYMVAQGYTASGWVDTGTPVAATIVAGGGKVSLSGADLVVASGAQDKGTPDPDVMLAQGEARYWSLAALGVSTPAHGATVLASIRAASRPAVAYAHSTIVLLSGAYATNAQRIGGVGISYSTGNRMLYAMGTSLFGTHLPDNSATQVVSYIGMLNRSSATVAQIYGTNADNTSITTATVLAGSGNAFTHIGLSAGAVYGNSVADATFGTLSWLVQIAAPS